MNDWDVQKCIEHISLPSNSIHFDNDEFDDEYLNEYLKDYLKKRETTSFALSNSLKIKRFEITNGYIYISFSKKLTTPPTVKIIYYTDSITKEDMYILIKDIGKYYEWLDDSGKSMMENTEKQKITLFELLKC
jgi:hypothetical protein